MLALRRTKNPVNRIQVVLIQHQLCRCGIEPDMLGRHSFGNGDHTVLAQDPGQGNLGGCDLVSTGNLLEGRAGQQLATLGLQPAA